MPTILPTMLRPRQEFPTPLFTLAAPLSLAGTAALLAYLLL